MKKAELEKALKETKEQASSLKDQLTLLQADFENAKKRWLKSQAEQQEQANADLLRQLLEIFDDFERALQTDVSQSDPKALRIGVEMIGKRFQEFLKSYGVRPLDAVQKPFDPSLHEAVAHEETSEVPESTVLSELRKGYAMNGRVLRPSVVKVAVKPAQKQPSSS